MLYQNNEIHKAMSKNFSPKNETWFQISDASHEIYHPQRFETEQEAREVIKTEYQNRSKHDGHDEYWRNKKQVVIKVTREVLG